MSNDDWQKIRAVCKDDRAFEQVRALISGWQTDDETYTQLLEKTQALDAFSKSIRRLHQIAVQHYESLDNMFSDYLEAGCDILGMTTGVLSQVYEPTQEYIVMAVHNGIGELNAGGFMMLGDTYEQIVARRHETVTYPRVAGVPGLTTLRFYREFGFQSFIGTPVWLEGELYGTLSFFSQHTRKRGFQDFEIELAEIMARDIGQAVLARRYEQRRQYMAERIAESERRYRALFEQNQDAVFIISLQGIIQLVNEQACALLGYTADELVGTRAEQHILIDAYQDYQDRLQKLLAGETLPMYERVFIDQQGQQIPTEISVTLVRDGDGKPKHLQSIVRNITERKQREQELRQGQTRLRTVMSNFPNGLIILFDTQQRFLLVDGAGLAELGVQKHIFEGRAPTELSAYMQHWPEDSLDRVQAWMATALAGQEVRAELRLGAADYEIHANPVYDHGNIIAGVATVENITDRKRFEAQMLQAKEHAEAANKAKSMFLASMSHELRTPLNAISGFAQLLSHGSVSPDGQQDYIQHIQSSSDYLLQLINDILETSKIEAGQHELISENFDLHELLHAMEAQFMQQTINKGLRLRFHLQANTPRFIHGDHRKLRQILYNLLSNAVKFTDWGEVTLDVAAAPLPDNNTELTFQVRDTGRGISQQEQNKLFSPFTQAEAGRRSGQQGTGLGLSISREFARLMSGDITLDSQPGQGSCFTLRVPLPVVDGALDLNLSQPRVVGLQPGQGPFRILIVDDLEENRMIVSTMLRNIGLESRLAFDGAEALHIVDEWQPHLVWMDIRMPGMNGVETTRAIKQKPHPPIIVALTAGAMSYERDEALQAGCDDFLAKPFLDSDIYERLGRHLGVEFIYEDAANAENADADAGWNAIKADPDYGEEQAAVALATFGPRVLRDLRRVAQDLDADASLKVIEQVRADAPELAYALRSWVNEFSFERVIAALDTAQQHDTGL